MDGSRREDARETRMTAREGARRRSRAVAVRRALVVAALLAASGCGTSETMPEDEAQGTVESFLAACAEDEGLAAVELLTEPTADAFLTTTETAEGCRKVLRLEAPDRPPVAAAQAFRDATVSEVHVEGGFGTAVVTIEGRSSRVELEEEAARWKLSNHPL
ncbi:MAG: hypothetical protein M3N16_03805 [Actinomycetota bacterium]|nr:hypothetical protein [Actinomycetota bacterium]